MFHRLAKFFVLIAAVQILGGHWAVLQSIAWAGMLVEYGQSDSLKVAITKTFDGDHPCSLCQSVSKGRQQEEKQESTVIVAKIDAVLAPALRLLPLGATDWSYPLSGWIMVVRDSAPPTPPPLV